MRAAAVYKRSPAQLGVRRDRGAAQVWASLRYEAGAIPNLKAIENQEFHHGYPDGQTFVGELVDEVEHAILPPFVRAILDEVIGPDMVGPLGAQTVAAIASSVQRRASSNWPSLT